MKNNELKKIKNEIKEYRKEALFDAFFPIGKSVPDLVGPFKIMLDIICVGCIISLPIVTNFLLPLIGTLMTGGISLTFFSYVLHDNLTNPKYEKLKEKYEKLKNEDNSDSNNSVKCVINNKSTKEETKESINNIESFNQFETKEEIDDELVKQIDTKIDELEKEKQPFVKTYKKR